MARCPNKVSEVIHKLLGRAEETLSHAYYSHRHLTHLIYY